MDLRAAYEERDYAAMAEWYTLNGTNTFFQMLLDGDIDEYLQERLLEEILPLLPKAETRKEKSVHDRMMDEPANVQAVYNKARGLFRQMKETRLLIFNESKEVRSAAALKVVELARGNKECWMDIDHYKKYGYLPSVLSDSDEIMAMNMREAAVQLDRDINYIYKFTKKMEKLKGTQRDEQAARIKIREVRITLLNKKLELYD